jgi:3-phosphoglycerate kinase
MKIKSYKQADLQGVRTVVMRVDANVEINAPHWWNVAGLGLRKYARVEAFLGEVEGLLAGGRSVVLLSHYGRPDGKRVGRWSLKGFADYLEVRLGRKVIFLKEIPAKRDWEKSGTPQLIVLENVRFWEGEEANDSTFAEQLASLGDVFVNNAFGVCHRKQASVHAITQHLPSFAGADLVREVAALSARRKQPLALVLGGIKLETKLPLLLAMESEVDTLFLGSGVALPFLVAGGVTGVRLPGSARVTQEQVRIASKIKRVYGHRLVLPSSYMVDHGGHVHEQLEEEVRGTIYDIGPAAFKDYHEVLVRTKTVVWNGPLGYVESRMGTAATKKLAGMLRKNNAHTTIVGGGDTVEFLDRYKLKVGMDVVSNGGGAMLAFLAGEKMPGLEPLI